MTGTDIFDALRGSLKRLKADGNIALEAVSLFEADIDALVSDFAVVTSEHARAAIKAEVLRLAESRPKHILALVEAQAGIEAAKTFEEVLTVGLSIGFKALIAAL